LSGEITEYIELHCDDAVSGSSAAVQEVATSNHQPLPTTQIPHDRGYVDPFTIASGPGDATQKSSCTATHIEVVRMVLRCQLLPSNAVERLEILAASGAVLVVGGC